MCSRSRNTNFSDMEDPVSLHQKTVQKCAAIVLIFFSTFLSAADLLKTQITNSSPCSSAQNDTAASMFLKKDGRYIHRAESATGDLWNEMGHHGPAVENIWAGYRIYFDRKAAFDLYSKARPGLELKQTKWYTSDKLKSAGFGSDLYWVGESIGAGSIRLWEDGEVKQLHPVKNRIATVTTEGSISQLDLLSEGVPYAGRTVDLLIRLTVFSGHRYARIEAFVFSDQPVQLVTGLNHNPRLKLGESESHLLTWGRHKTEHEVGAALLFNPEDFVKKETREQERLLISRPTRYLRTWITTASDLETEISNLDGFKAHVQKLRSELL